MKRRSKTTMLILLALILAALWWWTWPKGSSQKSRLPTGPQAAVAQVEAPKLPPVTPTASSSASNITETKDQPIADNEIGTINYGLLDLGDVNVHDGATKTFTLLSGKKLSLCLIMDKYGQPVLQDGQPILLQDYLDADGVQSSSERKFWSGKPVYEKIGNEMVEFTPVY